MKRLMILLGLSLWNQFIFASSFQQPLFPAIRQQPRIRQDISPLRLSSPLTTTAAIDEASSHTTTTCITPNQFFRPTCPGEVSVVTMNILAPAYNSLSIDNWDDRMKFLKKDRNERVPLAIQMAKQHNADILCLQEVEGGTDDLESALKKMLAEPCGVANDDDDKQHQQLQGYDMFLWASLLPNREDNVVGNCVAWRSSRHKLVAVDCFKRGMVCQMEEINEGASRFCVANVHLPAKPSNIMGRLKSMSKTIEKMTRLDAKVRKSPLDGLLIVAGDFNSDQESVTAKLLKTGCSPYGNLKERNYRSNLSKVSAFKLRHKYRFKDVYEGRRDVAPVTVSLTGRGPGCMDQIFFAQNSGISKIPPIIATPSVPVVNPTSVQAKPKRKEGGKRKARRQRVAWMQTRRTLQLSLPTAIRVESVLATISGPNDIERLETINNGLPNVEKGFPSDHVPIGALFVPDEEFFISKQDSPRTLTEKTSAQDVAPMNDMSMEADAATVSEINGSSGMASSVLKRREAATASVGVRRRHNAVLRCVTEWLTERGAYDIHRDEPLYKLKFAQGVSKLKKKSRAPDLVCCLGNDSLVVIEVTVSGKPDSARLSKLVKYEDLEGTLQTSPSVKDGGLTVLPPFVILLDEQGGIPHETREDLLELARLSSPDSTEEALQNDTQRFCNHLQGVFSAL